MANIKGRVVDYDNDSPISGVLVQGVAKDGTAFISGTTDSGGNFNLSNTGFDDLYSRVIFKKDGYQSQLMQPASANGQDVVLMKNGSLAAVTLTVKKNPIKALLFVAIGAAAVYLFIKYRSKISL